MKNSSTFKKAVSKAITPIFLSKTLNQSDRSTPVEIISNVYLGTLEDAFNPRILIEIGITHIVNVCQCENVFENGLEVAFNKIKLTDEQLGLIYNWNSAFVIPTYYRVAIADKSEIHFCTEFVGINMFVKSALCQNGRILIHCHQGISRSATAIIAFVMDYKNICLDEAFANLKSDRTLDSVDVS
jgi:predicted protein tyrosine phosphatase